MKIWWNGSLVDAIKMEGQFTLDTGSQVFSDADGEWILSANGKQIVVTDEEVLRQQEEFAKAYEAAYSEMPELDTEETW
jgi:hypothetical protein